MRTILTLLAVLATACAAYTPATYVTESANLPHMCGYGVSPYGTPGNGCWEGWECHPDHVCAKMPPHWNGPGTGSWGELP